METEMTRRHLIRRLQAFWFWLLLVWLYVGVFWFIADYYFPGKRYRIVLSIGLASIPIVGVALTVRWVRQYRRWKAQHS
jgi:hypothetical protein